MIDFDKPENKALAIAAIMAFAILLIIIGEILS